MRAFFCIPLGPEIAAAIGRIAASLRRATAVHARWVRTENYHVTLRFLGEIDPLLTVDLEQAARRICAKRAPFGLPLDRIGAFPSIERARVLWVGGDAPEFLGLTSSLHRELDRLGFPAERKSDLAHVTLARIKDRPDRRLAEALFENTADAGLAVVADRIALMQSELTPSGAVYTPLFVTRFKGR